jgi:hypothetical protein
VVIVIPISSLDRKIALPRRTLTSVANDLQTLKNQIRRLEQPVRSERLARGAVTSSKIAPQAVTGSQLARRSITLDKIAPTVVRTLTSNVTEAISEAATAVATAAATAAITDQAVRSIGLQSAAGNQGSTEIQGPAGPQGPAGLQGPQGLQGPTGLQGPSGIIDVRFAGSNESIPFTINQDTTGSALIELTLPPITVAPNQSIKLDAFANVNFANIQSYSVNSFISRNPDDIVAVNNAATFQSPNQPGFDQATVTTPLNWVDHPAPGTYNYSFTIVGFASAGFIEASVDSRGFTAVIISING